MIIARKSWFSEGVLVRTLTLTLECLVHKNWGPQDDRLLSYSVEKKYY